jgi:hypothetical protein
MSGLAPHPKESKWSNGEKVGKDLNRCSFAGKMDSQHVSLSLGTDMGFRFQ